MLRRGDNSTSAFLCSSDPLPLSLSLSLQSNAQNDPPKDLTQNPLMLHQTALRIPNDPLGPLNYEDCELHGYVDYGYDDQVDACAWTVDPTTR